MTNNIMVVNSNNGYNTNIRYPGNTHMQVNPTCNA